MHSGRAGLVLSILMSCLSLVTVSLAEAEISTAQPATADVAYNYSSAPMHVSSDRKAMAGPDQLFRMVEKDKDGCFWG